ncbi:hypothetical protein [Pontibacter russatus]|uniref:hypothetical protein n=1 Tax=Pontibacter russatus TaxID=2694929 RepID=UPI00137B87F0|nr:hypothetical protein [Pontibacter russatus]
MEKQNNFHWLKYIIIFLISPYLLSCEKAELNEEPKYFMTCKLNDMDWKADEGYGVAQLDYDYDAGAHFLWIWSQVEKPLPNGSRYQISLSVNQPVSTGKFYFDNSGIVMAANDGFYGNVHGWKKNGNDDYFSGPSINGFINITSLTKDNIGGVFEFTAVTHKTSSHAGNDTIHIEEGKFLIPINGVSGKKWDGPK